jgi:AcrR family transcriptional regulator
VAARAYRSPRREQAAAETQHAILDAAEELFVTQGYAGTTVNQVAAAASVSPNTVYVSIGGKPQLVVALVKRAAGDPLMMTSHEEIDLLTDGREILQRTAASTRVARRDQRSIAVMLDNLTADPLIAEVAQRATAVLRKRLHRIATRLAAVDALRDGITIARADAILWFYFSFTAWRELRAVGWSWKEIELWLCEQAIAALIKPAPA